MDVESRVEIWVSSVAPGRRLQLEGYCFKQRQVPPRQRRILHVILGLEPLPQRHSSPNRTNAGRDEVGVFISGGAKDKPVLLQVSWIRANEHEEPLAVPELPAEGRKDNA